jgi:hypothetical protein
MDKSWCKIIGITMAREKWEVERNVEELEVISATLLVIL